MRAILYPFDQSTEFLEITGDDYHHLCHVVRIVKSERVLVINGVGGISFSEVMDIDKKKIVLRLEASQLCSRKFNLDVAIAVPKKDAWELCLKYSAELGIRTVIPLETQYSQRNIILNQVRIDSLFKTAIEQSNNPFIPIMKTMVKLQGTDFKKYKKIFFFNSQTKNSPIRALNEKIENSSEMLIIIGPEGGFALDEIEWILSHENVTEVFIPTPILKTSTALPVSVGFIMREIL